MVLVSRDRCRIELAVALLDPPRTDMALHRDAEGLGDRWDMPRIVPVGSCRWRGRERARLSLGSARRVHVPLTWLRLFLAAARGLAG